MLADVAIAISYLLGVIIVWRAWRHRSLRRYGFFFSFFFYYLISGLAGWAFLLWIPAYYPHFFWIRFLTLVIAEFALLIQIADHVFRVFPGLRSIAKLLTVGVMLGFGLIFILPALLEARPSEMAIYDLVKRSALTKSVIILLLASVAVHFRVSVGRNIGGIAIGLLASVGINMANFALVEHLGWDRYGSVFATIGPISQTLMVLIWTVTLWKYEPPAPLEVRESTEPLSDKLMRYNTNLDRMLRR